MEYKHLFFTLFILFFQYCGQHKKHPATDGFSKSDFYTVHDFNKVDKIDAHVHIDTDKPDFVQQARDDNFKLLTINWDDPNESADMKVQQRIAIQQLKAFPGYVAYATTFSVRNFNDGDWKEKTIAYLKNSFAQGAIAVKVYKVIGMDLKDENGEYIMIDDPRFDPIIDFIHSNNIPIIGHLGEPKNCWLPLDKMTVNGDKSYFSENPEYHMYLHPEAPSYEDQIEARDNMLRKHPNLRFVGAHLGSLEWSVDELAKRLDEFPNMAVDMAGRISHLQYQSSINRLKVRDFVIKYQDRLIYGTDLSAEPSSDPSELKKRMQSTWTSDWKYFVSNESMTVSDFDGEFKGLNLPKNVVEKIYYTNAEKWFPGL
ncbi:amidohydrolase [Flavobacteriaceae bacterium F89]|uniref:Amidohydrolase n=1 Tax=Cerina litoralis TaxID=2874477 RepID=A0AAE3EXM1_9FLAO|nr:amidohydrolase family protein [Cerina litoralis]MCG2461651.1 amidohydrolase [Cerina litoralis]